MATHDGSEKAKAEMSNNPVQTRKGRVEVLWLPFGIWAISVIFTGLYSAYLYEALIAVEPRLGSLLLPASDMNLLLSFLSQAFAQLIETLVLIVLNALRWQLASSGTSLATFFGLSNATSWISILILTAAGGFRNLWGIFR
jgi:hypothetical protein